MVNLQKLAFTVTEAAQAAHVSRPTIYRWMRMGGFPVARIGGWTRIPAEAFKKWIEEQAGVQE